MNANPKELALSLLKTYTTTEQTHICGLCHWLSMEALDLEQGINVYHMVCEGRELLPQYGQGARIPGFEGQTELRIKLAHDLMELLTSGRLFHDGVDWVTKT